MASERSKGGGGEWCGEKKRVGGNKKKLLLIRGTDEPWLVVFFPISLHAIDRREIIHKFRMGQETVREGGGGRGS